MARDADHDYEFQCLHGMGERLYDEVIGVDQLDKPCRIYAPVGSHKTLLAYLVRRLLENGANSSFVSQLVDENVSMDDLAADPVTRIEQENIHPHPAIPLPRDLYGAERRNSSGIDLSDEHALSLLASNWLCCRHSSGERRRCSQTAIATVLRFQTASSRPSSTPPITPTG